MCVIDIISHPHGLIVPEIANLFVDQEEGAKGSFFFQGFEGEIPTQVRFDVLMTNMNKFTDYYHNDY
jgi:hypothetical protein